MTIDRIVVVCLEISLQSLTYFSEVIEVNNAQINFHRLKKSPIVHPKQF